MTSRVSHANRTAVFERDHHTCQYCRTPFHTLPWEQWTVDHVIPRSRGGSNRVTNLVACCQECNLRKGDGQVEPALVPVKQGLSKGQKRRRARKVRAAASAASVVAELRGLQRGLWEAD